MCKFATAIVPNYFNLQLSMNILPFFSSKSDEWTTPVDLFKKLDDQFHFTLDPCSTDFNHLCDIYFTIDDNGLDRSWRNHVVFCNPPYSHVTDWVEKCWVESISNNTIIVLLVPARTDTIWFHKYIYSNTRCRIEFLKGRLKFGDSKNSAPFPSMLVYFNC